VEAFSASPGFRDIVAFKETIAVSARAGLFIYDRNGGLVASYRAGLELPPAELGAMSTGIAAGSAEPEIFIATRGEGVLAFNGTRIRQILPADASLQVVTAVLVSGSGRILIGTERRGVAVFDGRRLSPFLPALKNANITALAGDEGDLWLGTLDRGLFHYHGGQLDDLAANLPDPRVLSIEVAGGEAFAGTPLGVVEFRDGRRVRVLADGFFGTALARGGDALYIGTEDEGIVETPLAGRGQSLTDSPTGAIVRLANLEGQIYAASSDAIYRYDPSAGRWRSTLAGAGFQMTDRNVAALSLIGGRLWAGYFDRGLDILDAGPGTRPAIHREDDTLFCINRIVEDGAGARTAVATANGLVLFDSSGRPRQTMGRKDGLLADHVTDVAFREGGMVVATPAGLSFVDRSGVRSLYVFHGLVNNHVYTVAARGRETVAGTLGGISILDDDAVRANYTTANSRLKANWITAVAPVGDEWFAGTYGAGVLRLDAHGEWHAFTDFTDAVVNPNAMLASGGRIYAGTLGRGLFIFDRETGRWTSTAMGLPSRNVTALAAGGGYLYVGTDNGLVRIAEGELR
jgi:ligand-binding sensor domain-containing protein